MYLIEKRKIERVEKNQKKPSKEENQNRGKNDDYQDEYLYVKNLKGFYRKTKPINYI